MQGKDIYKIFAPDGTKWTNWVRPVPFVAIDTYNRKPIYNWENKKNLFIKEYKEDTAYFIDFNGVESIEYAISLAKIGYRPIPIFNGTDEPIGATRTTDTENLECALINAAGILKDIKLDKNANPVFILDNRRLDRYRSTESIFDNSWDLYGQDIPSYDYFIQNGIKKIVILGKTIEKDLRKIFFKFQENGIEFYLTDGYSEEVKQVLKKTLKERLEKEEL